MDDFKISSSNFKEYSKGKDDCWSLAVDIYRENGLYLPNHEDVRTMKKRNEFKNFLLDNVEYEETGKIERGVFLLIESDPWHCGIAVDDKRMIHRLQGINTRIDRIQNYEEKIKGIYLVKTKLPR